MSAETDRRVLDADHDATGAPELLEEPETEVDVPQQYHVLLHNDDYTTTEFVVEVLVTVFHKPVEDAIRIMLDVHRNGIGTAGTYTYDIATTKAQRVRELAREREFPLRCTVEPA